MISKQDKTDIRKRVEQIQGAIELLKDATRGLARSQEELFNAVPYEDWGTPQCRSAYQDIHRNILSALNGLGAARSDLQQAKNALRPLDPA
jgi:hypothetical protein